MIENRVEVSINGGLWCYRTVEISGQSYNRADDGNEGDAGDLMRVKERNEVPTKARKNSLCNVEWSKVNFVKTEKVLVSFETKENQKNKRKMAFK